MSYRNIPLSADSWVDCQRFLPVNYDLVLLKTTEGKEKPGWWAEKKWAGLRIKKSDKITEWKLTFRGGE